jgi:predicted CoA-binding protein
MPITDDEGLRELLDYKTVAVIGCSSTPGKAAHEIPKYLDEHGYEVIPVNPFADEIFGREPYDSLAEVEEDIDLVDVFRPSMEVPSIVEQVIARSISRQDVNAIWLQQGISHDEAADRAEDQGLKIVQDRCMKVEHQRLR